MDCYSVWRAFTVLNRSTQKILGRFRRLLERERLNVMSWPQVRGQVCFQHLNFGLNA